MNFLILINVSRLIYLLGKLTISTTPAPSFHIKLLNRNIYSVHGTPIFVRLSSYIKNKKEKLQKYIYVLSFFPLQCEPGLGASVMYNLLYNKPQKLMLLAGCSTVCTTVAEAAKMWNLIVVSCCCCCIFERNSRWHFVFEFHFIFFIIECLTSFYLQWFMLVWPLLFTCSRLVVETGRFNPFCCVIYYYTTRNISSHVKTSFSSLKRTRENFVLLTIVRTALLVTE